MKDVLRENFQLGVITSFVFLLRNLDADLSFTNNEQISCMLYNRELVPI